MVDTDRRWFLRYAASLAPVLLENKVGETLEPEEAARNASRTGTLAADNTSQYRGDERNTGYKQRSDGKSPTTVENVKELGTLGTGEFTGPPVTTPGGQYAVPGENVVGLANSEAGSFMELGAAGETSPPIFIGETHLSFGDIDGIKKFDATTGSQTDIIDYFTGEAGEAYVKYDGKGYISRSNATEEVELEEFNSSPLNNTNATATGQILLLDDGETIVRKRGDDLIRYDISSESEVEKVDVDANDSGLSSDGDYIFGTSSDHTIAYDAETLERVGRAPKDGASGHPPTIVEGEDGTEVYSTEGFDGVIKGYEFEGEEFNHKWDYKAEGTVGDLIAYEGIIVGSGSKKTVAVNKETGEKEWEENIPGRVGTPYDDKIPIAGHDGTLYELEMGMSEVGCVPRRGVSRGQEGEDCYDSAREDALSNLRDRHGPDREDWDTRR